MGGFARGLLADARVTSRHAHVLGGLAARSAEWVKAVENDRILPPRAGQVLWTVGFAGGGAAVLVKVLTQSSMPPDARLGASIVAAVFIPMGLSVGAVGLVQLVRSRRGGSTGSRRTKDGDLRRRDVSRVPGAIPGRG